MKVKEVPIGELKPYPNNPRVNDQAVQGVADSLQAFGWQQPIVVDSDNVVIVGHTRLKAAGLLGMDKVPVVVADGLTPDEVAAYRLADNKTAEASFWDVGKLDIEMKGIELDLSPWFDNQDLSISPEDFGAEFTLPDGDAPGIRSITIYLSGEQYEEVMDILGRFDDECRMVGGNPNGNKICEMVRQWAGR